MNNTSKNNFSNISFASSYCDPYNIEENVVDDKPDTVQSSKKQDYSHRIAYPQAFNSSEGNTDLEDNDSNSSTQTLDSFHDSATLTSSDIDDPNWKGYKTKPIRPLSESISVDDFNSIRLRPTSNHQLKDHRTSADVYLLENANKNIPRYSAISPSASPKQLCSQNTQFNSNTYFGADSLSHLYPNTNFPGHFQMLDKSLNNLSSYQMMQPNAFQRANYPNLCRLGCDHCLPVLSCHPSLYDPHLSINGSQYWDFTSSSVPNSLFLSNNANLTAHQPSTYASQTQLGQLPTRKVC